VGAHTITEIIAACGWESIAPRPGRSSFTRALIEVLQDWIDQPFSAAMLHSKVLSTLKHERPERWQNEPHKVELRRTPVYIVSTTKVGVPSVVLCRQKVPTRSATASLNELQIEDSGKGEDQFFDAETEAPNFLNEAMSLTPDGHRKCPHVLISLALEEDQILDSRTCSGWLSRFPALAKYAQVQGVYKSYSTLIIASIPVSIWNLLPDDMSASFIGFVQSENLVRGDSFRSSTSSKSQSGTLSKEVDQGVHVQNITMRMGRVEEAPEEGPLYSEQFESPEKSQKLEPSTERMPGPMAKTPSMTDNHALDMSKPTSFTNQYSVISNSLVHIKSVWANLRVIPSRLRLGAMLCLYDLNTLSLTMSFMQYGESVAQRSANTSNRDVSFSTAMFQQAANKLHDSVLHLTPESSYWNPTLRDIIQTLSVAFHTYPM